MAARQSSQKSPAKPSRTKTAFEYVSAHFLLFSALAIVLGVLAATVFLYGYISVFDWRLIWVIEYPDVLKVGLVAIAIISGFVTWFRGVIEGAFPADDTAPKTKKAKAEAYARHRKKVWIGLGLIGSSLIVFLLLAWSLGGSIKYGPVIGSHMLLVLLFFIVMTMIERLHGYTPASVRAWVEDFFYVVVFVYGLGGFVGVLMQERDGFLRDVYTANQQFREVGLVMITSRYVVLWRDGHSLVLPVSEVMRIEERPRRTSG